jgi:hypothetical protein
MNMPITNLQFNWSAVTFNSTTLIKITQGHFNQGGQLLGFSGDTDIFPTTIINSMNNPTAGFTSGNIAQFQGISPGTTGTLSATLNDAKAQTGGAIVYSLINATFQSADASASHGAYGTVTGTWLASSSDGQTSPLSFTRA